MSFGKNYFGLEAERSATAVAVAVFLKAIVLVVAAVVLIYPAVPADFFCVDGPWGGTRYIMRGLEVFVPFNLLWALEGFRNVHVVARALVALTLAFSALAPAPKADKPAWFSRVRVNKRVVLIAVVAAAPVICYLLSVDYGKNILFADAYSLPTNVVKGKPAPAEVLSFHIYIWLRCILDLFQAGPNGFAAIALASCLCGGAFAAGTYLFADAAGEGRAEKVSLFLGGLIVGYAVLFVGYVETTQVELAAMALFLGAGAKALRAEAAGARMAWAAACVSAASFAFMAHGAGILLLPALVFFMVKAKPRYDGGRRRFWSLPFPALMAVLFALLVVLPYVLLIARPFYFRGIFGNLGGGGDQIMFVPRHIVCGLPKSRCVNYTMLSTLHLADINSAFILGAPFSIPLILSGTILLLKARRRMQAVESRILWFLALAAAACLAVPLVWNHDFGMWGDWNLAVCFLFPLNIFSWALFVYATRRVFRESLPRLCIALPLVGAQFVLAFGILFQFY